jgi:retron-type reverse transcriptase
MQLGSMFNSNCNNTLHVSDAICIHPEEHLKTVVTFDIKDLYINIPITETLAITKQLLFEHNEEQITTQILMLLESVLQQNYYFQNTYQPEKGVSMGSPISNTVAEIFLQYLENTYLSRNKSYSTLGTSMMY